MWHVACRGGMKNVFGILIVKPEWKGQPEI
jgi:hypothetical protein